MRYHLMVIKKLQGFVSSSNFSSAPGDEIPFDGNKETSTSSLASLKDCHMSPRSFEGQMTLFEDGRTVFGVKTNIYCPLDCLADKLSFLGERLPFVDSAGDHELIFWMKTTI